MKEEPKIEKLDIGPHASFHGHGSVRDAALVLKDDVDILKFIIDQLPKRASELELLSEGGGRNDNKNILHFSKTVI